MLRQSGNILDIARATCSHSNRVLGFVSQPRVHLLVKGPCRTANSCKPGLVVGALRIACNGLCTAARFHTAEDNPGCRLGCLEEHDCLRHYNGCPILFDHLNSFRPSTNSFLFINHLTDLMRHLLLSKNDWKLDGPICKDATCPAEGLQLEPLSVEEGTLEGRPMALKGARKEAAKR